MGKRRSMLRKKKYDDATFKLWSDLAHDALFLVMMKLGVVDFIAFNRVCKSWRSVAVSNRNKFIVSRPPMSILPHLANSANRTCVGVTCGYLILFCKTIKNFWLVNLITRHELHFPKIPTVSLSCIPDDIRATLIFSPSISQWVFVLLHKCYDTVWFCIAGKREWTQLSTDFFCVSDIISFKEKIYTVHSDYESNELGICEMKIYPEPKLVLLETESFPELGFRFPGLVSCGENLYVIDRASEHPYKIHELDFGKMKWVSREKEGEKYAFFHSNSEDSKYPELYDGRYVETGKKGKGGTLYASTWYFFHDFFDANLMYR